MSFEDHWEGYNFRNKCNLNAPAFYRPQVFDINEVKSIALHAYNAGQEDITPKEGNLE